MKKNLRQIVILLGNLIGVGMFFLLWHTFLTAFANGGTVVIDVNSIGEANIEYVLLPILAIITVISSYFVIKGIMGDKL